jgi:exodeoxyribonuclease-3
MKLVTWNVNSLRTRLERVQQMLAQHQPDVVCLQETKLPDDQFPVEVFESLGYRCAALGQKGGYNGVALIARQSIANVQQGFDGDPIPEQARVISADIGGVRVASVYVVNGQSVESDKYPLKLAWLDALIAWLDARFDASQPLILAGDFNIAPDDRDIHDPAAHEGQVHCSEPERERLGRLERWGLRDLLRERTNETVYSWWDYRHGAFHRNWGRRIDLILGTDPMARRCEAVTVDREARKATSGPGKPSDHAPVIATFAE